MIVSIMQPYFFPYLGYFNLLHSSDVFVLFDDVQFIRRGWINRNRIQLNGEAFTFTVPVAKSSRDTPINQIAVSPEHFDEFAAKFFKQLKTGYGTAPFYDDVVALVRRTMSGPCDSIALLAERSIREVLAYVGIEKDIRRASALAPPASGQHLKGQDRLVHIATAMGANQYNNPPGGRDLYSPEAFADEGIALRFIQPDLRPYDRPSPFIPGLSVLDVLMHVPPIDVAQMIALYSVEK